MPAHSLLHQASSPGPADLWNFRHGRGHGAGLSSALTADTEMCSCRAKFTETARTWTNQRLTVFHGTDRASAQAIKRQGIDLNRCKKATDFGQGFYTTTHLAQAMNWANNRVLNSQAITHSSGYATVLSFTVDRDEFASLETLIFIRSGRGSDYWSFIAYCRQERTLHGRAGNLSHYESVSGPVSLWPQTHIIADADQLSFHGQSGVAALNDPTIHTVAQTPSGVFDRHAILAQS